MASQIIFVAEDDAFLANAYKSSLANAGFDVTVVSDGNALLELLKKKKQPALILLDLVMPVKDGFETLKDLKSDESLADIPVIVASNLGDKDDITKGIALGAKDYIVKTDTSVEELIRKVTTTISPS